jgi:hypothetical protein
MAPQKFISLGGAVGQTNYGDPTVKADVDAQSYLSGAPYPANRPYVQNHEGILRTNGTTPPPTRWVKIWVNWRFVQEGYKTAGYPGSDPATNLWDTSPANSPHGRPPPNMWASFHSLNQHWKFTNPNELDAQIKALNDDGKNVCLTIDSGFPLWSSQPWAETEPDWTSKWWSKASEDSRKTNPNLKVPDSAAPDSPFGWFIFYLLCRYKYLDGGSGHVNPAGPNPNDAFGNPVGACVNALEVCNEWNRQPTLPWQSYCRAAEAMRTAINLSAWCCAAGPPYQWSTPILGCGTSDRRPGDASYDTGIENDPYEWTRRFIDQFGTGAVPSNVYFGWSHHNYTDYKYNSVARLQAVLLALSQGGYNGTPWLNSAKDIFLTEGGYYFDPDYSLYGSTGHLFQEGTQRALMQSVFDQVAAIPQVKTFAQYMVAANEYTGNKTSTELREVYPVSGGLATHTRDALTTWARLEGA